MKTQRHESGANGRGHYATKYTAEDVLETFSDAAVPVLTSNEVAGFLDCTSETARQKLEALVEDEELIRKKVGSRAVVYIRLATEENRLNGYGEWKQGLWE